MGTTDSVHENNDSTPDGESQPSPLASVLHEDRSVAKESTKDVDWKSSEHYLIRIYHS
jgi:hypothetical protein